MSAKIHVRTSDKEAGSVPVVKVDQPLTLVIFGGTGDLTRRKLLPGLLALFDRGMLPEQFAIVGFGRRDYDTDSYRALMGEEVRANSRVVVSDARYETFMQCISYFKGDLENMDSFVGLYEQFKDVEAFPASKVFYLSTAPSYFSLIISSLRKAGLVNRPEAGKPSSRVVIEKPFGHDFQSAYDLNQKVLRLLDESQVYRIDHYLGKETVQNIISFRFANAIFEPVFNSRYVDHIQVSASETVGMESGRGAYYDKAGGLRDMMQNHLLQLLCLVTMEPPSGLAADAIRNEKVKVLQSVRPPSPEEVEQNVIRAQYAAGTVDGEPIVAYVNEDRVSAGTRTETFVAAKLFVENWRWAGVPMYLRTGKRMKNKATSISIQFKVPPLKFFRTLQCDDDICDFSASEPNVLTFWISPNEGISLSFSAKRPSMQLVVENAKMDFKYDETWDVDLPEAYETLLMDIMRGDSTLFTRSDEVEAAWRIVDPILDHWRDRPEIPLHLYEPGTWGPLAAEELMHEGAAWVNEE